MQERCRSRSRRVRKTGTVITSLITDCRVCQISALVEINTISSLRLSTDVQQNNARLRHRNHSGDWSDLAGKTITENEAISYSGRHMKTHATYRATTRYPGISNGVLATIQSQTHDREQASVGHVHTHDIEVSDMTSRLPGTAGSRSRHSHVRAPARVQPRGDWRQFFQAHEYTTSTRCAA